MVSQSSSVGYTIMGKTADLTVVQKTTIDTLHKEGKTQKVIAKEAGCSQSSVSKHINREAKGRKRCGRKKCTSNRDNRTLERIVKQNPFKMWGRFTKSGLQLESVLQEPLLTDICKTWVSAVAFLVSSHSWTTDSVRSVSTGLLLSGPKLCSLMKVNFAFPLKSGSQSLEEERRGTESTLLEVQCKVSTVSDGLGCHVICWCWSTVFSEVQGQHSRIPGSFRALHASCCWPSLWRCRFHFPTGLGTCTQCQSYQYLV